MLCLCIFFCDHFVVGFC